MNGDGMKRDHLNMNPTVSNIDMIHFFRFYLSVSDWIYPETREIVSGIVG